MALAHVDVDYRLNRPLALHARLRVAGFTVLLGRSGAGKTTLLKALAGLLPAEGTPFAGLRAERRPVGYLPQHYALFPHLTALGNVAFGLAHLSRREREVRARDLLERVGLLDYADRYPRALSGGQGQRVALARALAREPELLLLDEPTSALDAATRETVMEGVIALVRELGLPTLAVSHDPALAQLADRVAVLAHGRVMQEGSALEIFARPATPEVAALVGFVNLFSGRVVGVEDGWLTLDTSAGPVRAHLPAGVTGLAAGSRVRWGVRPEEVLVVRPGRGHSATGDTRLEGRLATLRPHGLGYKAKLESEGGLALELHLSRAAMARLELSLGERLEVKLKADFLHVMLAETA